MDKNIALLGIGLFWGALVMILFIFLLVVLPLYILGSLGLMKIADRYGRENTWMAWMPIARDYLLGRVALTEKMGWILLALSVVLWLNFAFGRIIMPIVVLAWFIFQVVALHKVYEKMSNKAVVMTVFTVLTFGVIGPIFLFAIRNNDIIADHAEVAEKNINMTTK